MNISDELEKLRTLLQDGTLTPQEFEVAKQRVLNGPAPAESTRHLEEIKQQNEIAQLDREWAIERENYMITGRYGSRHVPTKSGSVIGGLVIVGFGTFWTIMAATMTQGGPWPVAGLFPLFGVMFVLGGAAMSIRGFVQAGKYADAYQRYQVRRQDLQG